MKLRLTARIKKTAAEDWRKKYDRVYPFNDVGLARVVLNGKWGFVDETGNEVVPPMYDYVEDHGGPAEDWRKKYDRVEPFNDVGLARVELNGKWGFVDEDGNEVTPLKYDYVEDHGGPAEDWRKKYDEVEDFSEGLAGVRLNGKWGFVDETGKVVIPLKYDWAFDFHNGIARVGLGDLGDRATGKWPTGKWISIDQQGNEVDE